MARHEEHVGLGFAEAVAFAVIDLDVDAGNAGAVAAPVASLISRLPPTWSP
jgi:hypothetical protein